MLRRDPASTAKALPDEGNCVEAKAHDAEALSVAADFVHDYGRRSK